MVQIYLIIIHLLISFNANDKNRVIQYGDIDYQTTYDVPGKFIGKYEGRRSGYLDLKGDGTGTYHYDVFGFAPPTCERKPIELIWGFLLDDKGEVVKQKRDYGYSYPVLLQSTGTNSFQGCRRKVIKDFILQKGETLHVSSSDDWEK